jgi:hypothetical protein
MRLSPFSANEGACENDVGFGKRAPYRQERSHNRSQSGLGQAGPRRVYEFTP